MDLGLRDKIAIVTGASKGLGLASARALVEEGCRVTICARGDAALTAAAAELRTLSSDSAVHAVQADVATAQGVEHVVAETAQTFGGLDILINNVGLGRGSDILRTTDEEW